MEGSDQYAARRPSELELALSARSNWRGQRLLPAQCCRPIASRALLASMSWLPAGPLRAQRLASECRISRRRRTLSRTRSSARRTSEGVSASGSRTRPSAGTDGPQRSPCGPHGGELSSRCIPRCACWQGHRDASGVLLTPALRAPKLPHRGRLGNDRRIEHQGP